MEDVLESEHFRCFLSDPQYVEDTRDGRRLKRADLATKIEIYEDRLNSWFFDVVEDLKSKPAANFALLSLLLPQIEALEQMRRGEPSKGRSEEFFSAGLKRIAPHLTERGLGKIYTGGRCGLLHDGMTRHSVGVDEEIEYAYDPGFSYEDTAGNTHYGIVLNPHKLLDAFRKDFESYIKSLKDPSSSADELRMKFERMYSAKPSPPKKKRRKKQE